MNLKAKFLIPAVVLLFLGMGLSTVVTYKKTTNMVMNLSTEQAKSDLSSVVSLVELWVKGIQEVVVASSAIDSLADFVVDKAASAEKKSRIGAILKNTTDRFPGLDNLMLVNKEGRVVCAAIPGKIVGADLSDRDYIKQAAQGQNVISKPVISVDKGAPVFVVASPMKVDGTVVGVIMAGVDITYFSEKFVTPLSGSAGELFILSPDGLVIAHPDKKTSGKIQCR